MYKNGDACPICEEGTLTSNKINADFEYKGHCLNIPEYLVWECGRCKEKLVDHKTSKEAGRKIRDFHRKIDGLLTANDIKRIRKFKLWKNQDELSLLLGGGAKSFARYENSEVTQSESMDNLLRVLDKYPQAISVLEQKYHVAKPVEFSFTSILRAKEPQIKVSNG